MDLQKIAIGLEWESIPDQMTELTEKCIAPTWAVKRALWHPTSVPTSFFYLSESPTLLISAPEKTADLDFQKAACGELFGRDNVEIRIGDPGNILDDGWVKIAETNAIRRLGEYLNFFPGKYPGGLENSPSPVASMLTSGLVGAGLGYGTGYLAEQVLPASWKRKKLRNLLAMVGAGVGAAPGATWAYTNAARGKPFNSSDLTTKVGPELLGPQHMSPFPKKPNPLEVDPRFQKQEEVQKYLDQLPSYDFDSGEVTDKYKAACDEAPCGDRLSPGLQDFLKKARSYANQGHQTMAGVPPVQKDYLGRVTWGDNLIGNSLNARQKSHINTVVDAASRMPGSPGKNLVSASQFGNLAMNMGKGYALGALVGAGLGLIGAPTETQRTLARTGMWGGVANSLITALF